MEASKKFSAEKDKKCAKRPFMYRDEMGDLPGTRKEPYKAVGDVGAEKTHLESKPNCTRLNGKRKTPTRNVGSKK